MSRAANRYADSKYDAMKRAIAPMLCVLVLFYLGFHTVSGDRGLFALFKESRKLEALKVELSEVHAELGALEKKVSLLSGNSLDLDLLDEQARLVLGLVGRDELVIFLEATE